MNFTKMQALGNDFVVLEGDLALEPRSIEQLCDRRQYVGADGVVEVNRLGEQAINMRYWNADGSNAEMCGNGLRCAVLYAVERELVEPGELIVETDSGPLRAYWDGVDQNEIATQIGRVNHLVKPMDLFGFTVYPTDVGNPHVVTFVDDVEEVNVAEIGPQIEADPMFPNGTNVEFAEVDRLSMRLRVWERGVGETPACGTGMVASAIVANGLDLVSLPLKVEVPGGSAMVDIDRHEYGRITGPAAIAFSGNLHNWPLPE